MTQAVNLIQSAYREGNLIPVGKQPTTDEQTEALERLNRFVQGVFGYEMGENLADWPVPTPQRTAPVAANYPQLPYPQGLDAELLTTPYAYDPSGDIFRYPPANSRIVWGGITEPVYFPEAPKDGARMALILGSGAGDGAMAGQVLTLNGNGRTIQGVNTQTFAWGAAFTAKQWLYRADLGDWMLVQDMALMDQCPFPSELDDLWICMLAMRLAPRYNKTTAPETERTAINMMAKMKTRYEQAGNTTYNSQDIPRGLQSYISGRWFF